MRAETKVDYFCSAHFLLLVTADLLFRGHYGSADVDCLFGSEDLFRVYFNVVM